MHKDKVLEIFRSTFDGIAQDFASAIEAVTREECAKLVDSMLKRDSDGEIDYPEEQPHPADIARAIRNMGKEG